MGLFNWIKTEAKAKLVKKEENYRAFDEDKIINGSYPDFERKILGSSSILLIAGKRGSGKTALGMRFLELFKNKSNRKCYAMGFSNSKLPFWINKVNSLDEVGVNSVLLVDEGGITFSSRNSMNDSNKDLANIMAIARHKNLSLLLITQNSAMIDVNVLRLADSLLLKEPSLMQTQFERKAIKEIYEKIIPHFQDKENKHSYFYIWDDDFEGLLKYDLPSFWSDNISKSFR